MNLTENMGRETEAYWIWHRKQDWRNWNILHLTSRLFTTNTHKATLGSEAVTGLEKITNFPSLNLVFKEKILNSVTSTKHMNTIQKQRFEKSKYIVYKLPSFKIIYHNTTHILHTLNNQTKSLQCQTYQHK
jgi:hypothetical protein